ncbi:Peptidase S8/S53 domain containing protein [Rhypophila decipiens]
MYPVWILWLALQLRFVHALQPPRAPHQDADRRLISRRMVLVGAHDGRGDTTMELKFWFSTPHAVESEAIKRLETISDPDSALFGQFWNDENIVKHFAPPPEHIRTVARWLNESGVPRPSMRLSGDRSYLSFNTTLDQANRLLNTKLNARSSKKNKAPSASQMAADMDYRAYNLPAYVSDKIDLVAALASGPTTVRKRSRSAKITSRIRSPAPRLNPRQSSGAPVQVDCRQYMSPDCLRRLYNMPDLAPNATTPHPRSSLGIYQNAWSTWLADDLDTFFSSFQPQLVGRRPIMQPINGGYRYEPTDPSQVFPVFNLEANLDFEYAMSLAYPVPVTNIQVGDAYLLGNTNLMLAAYSAHYCQIGLDPAYDPIYPDTSNAGQPGAYNSSDCGTYAREIPNVISISVAWNEASFSKDYARRQCTEFLKLALKGITVIAATGDHGTADQRQQCLNPQTGKPDPVNLAQGNFASGFPASCPWVTAIGGTWWADPTNPADTGEAAFNQTISDGVQVTSAGGFSNVFGRPSFQALATPKYLAEQPGVRSLSEAGRFSLLGRGLPDVSAMARNYLVALHGSFHAVGGTSAAAPVIAAMVARINDARFKQGKGPVGLLNPVLYAKADRILRNDVEAGSNSGCGVDEAFPASKGWDAVTGLGTVDFAHKSSLSAHKGPKRVAIRTKKLHLLNNNEDQKRSLLLPGRERVSEPSSPPLFWDKLRTQQNDGHVSITVDALPHGVSDDSVSQHRFPTLGGVALTYG